jgi:hypothetical protein
MSPSSITDVTEVICYIASIDDDMIRDRHLHFFYEGGILVVLLTILLSIISDCLQEGDLNEQAMIHMCDVYVNCDTNVNTLHQIVKDSVISFGNYEHFNSELLRWLIGLTRLQYMDADLGELSHDCMEQLLSFIQTSSLKVISLTEIPCTMKKCEGHMLDLGRHNDLQRLYIVCQNVIISNINTESLKYLRVNPHSISYFSLLSNARCLTELELISDPDNRFLFTREINSVLHTLHRLETLMLHGVDITSSTLTVNSSMTCLKDICLSFAKTTMENMQKFVDSLCHFQNSVNVMFSGLENDAYIDMLKSTEMLEVTGMTSEDDGWQKCEFKTVK